MGPDVDKRTWENYCVELADFRGTNTSVSTYYTEFNNAWVKLDIFTNLTDTPLQISDSIYSTMDAL